MKNCKTTNCSRRVYLQNDYCLPCRNKAKKLHIPIEQLPPAYIKSAKLLKSGRIKCVYCHRTKSVEWFRISHYKKGAIPVYRPECKECARKAEKKRYLLYGTKIRTKRKGKVSALRKSIILGYGGKCCCCEESIIEFLCVDHKNNDGAAERRRFGSSSVALFSHIIAENFPDRYQILCWNCNASKGQYGYCPHQTGSK